MQALIVRIPKDMKQYQPKTLVVTMVIMYSFILIT